eukprot:72237-Prymnesium_polylepis.2
MGVAGALGALGPKVRARDAHTMAMRDDGRRMGSLGADPRELRHSDVPDHMFLICGCDHRCCSCGCALIPIDASELVMACVIPFGFWLKAACRVGLSQNRLCPWMHCLSLARHRARPAALPPPPPPARRVWGRPRAVPVRGGHWAMPHVGYTLTITRNPGLGVITLRL